MKKDIRSMVRSRLRALDNDTKAAYSANICHSLCEHDAVRSARTVALFVSLADEPDTAALVNELCKSHNVVLPVVCGDTMDFYPLASGSLRIGAFGILEPERMGNATAPADIDVVVVPGVAFTPGGARLGRGKGYYDKYMSRNGFRAYKIGVCFSCQLVDFIPCEEHDVFMNDVVYNK